MNNNITALARWNRALSKQLPQSTSLPITDVSAIGPFDNTGYKGLLTTYEVETNFDMNKSYQGRDGLIDWVAMPHYSGIENDYMDLGIFMPSSPWSVCYIVATIDSPTDQIAQLSLEVAGMCWAWLNGQLILAPTVARQCNMLEDTLFVSLKKGKNTLLLKAHYGEEPWVFKWQCKGFGAMENVCDSIGELTKSSDSMIALTAKYTLAEIYAAFDIDNKVSEIAKAITEDKNATIWDKTWAETLINQKNETGCYLPTRDLKIDYKPVENTSPCATLWLQVPETSKELFVLDTSSESPQVEFACKILQGIVNREKPSLYITHTMYAKQDRQWMDELCLEAVSYTHLTLPTTPYV
jgi:hypothetical protein